MPVLVHSPVRPPQWQIALSASGIAGAQFARCGLDVTVLSGPERPWHDLVVTRSGNLFKVCVLPSADGRWDLTQAYRNRAVVRGASMAECHRAIDMWLDKHDARMVCCLVQFLGVSIDQLPRIYLATPYDIAQKLREALDCVGEAILWEERKWVSDRDDSRIVEKLPADWLFSAERVQQLLNGRPLEAAATPRPPVARASVAVLPSSALPTPVDQVA
jgi:hypothetical protein